MHASSSSNSGDGRRGRAHAARLVLAVIFAVLGLRLIMMQVVRHEYYADLARSNILREEVLPAIRGVIRARDGEVLVDAVPSFTVAIDPFDRAYLDGDADLEKTLRDLAPMIDVPIDVMLVKIEAQKRRSYRPVRLKRHLEPATVAYVEERRNRLPGVVVEVEPLRRNVHGGLCAHVLGYVGEVSGAEIGLSAGERTYITGDSIGRTGIESHFEVKLCGTNGRRMVEVNALGRRSDVVLPKQLRTDLEPPTHGEDVYLTLDLAIQRAASAAFPDSMSGAVVVMDVRDGGVLAMVSRPTFDPNEFAAGLSQAQWDELNSDPRHPLHDRALMAGYPPGSVFKIVTGIAALSERLVGLGETLEITCNGGMQLGNRWFGCHASHGVTQFASAMRMSCDVYFYQLGLRLGLDRIASYARDAGFGERTGFELSESTGLVPNAEWYRERFGKRGWRRGHLLNLAIGQGEILATPLQMAHSMALVARGWRPITPYIVRQVGDSVLVPTPAPQRLDVEPSLQRALVGALEDVVNHQRGTGRNARVAGLRIAGKTGTAQNPHGEDHAVFTCFAPVDAPRVAIAVVVEHGGHGGATAAPVAARVLEACFDAETGSWAMDETAGGGARATE